MSERYAGRFLLLRQLGEGGMGEVFLARDLSTGTECAIKRLPLQSDTDLEQRLRSEFETLSRIRHPAVVEVRELGFAPDGRPFLVMEYVPGLPADRALGRGDWPALLWVAARVIHGLEALHAAGIAHGDVKPLNVLVTPAVDAASAALPSDVRLVDFGLASLTGQRETSGAGTTGFTAPEVARGGAADAVSDLYSFGATLYALVVGSAPFGSGPASSVLRRQIDSPPSPEALERAGAPEGLVRLVLHLLSPQRAERPTSAREVRLELEALHPMARRPLGERLETDVFVGRAREAARVEAAWKGALVRTRALLVEGPAGIGKTALLDRTAARAAVLDHPVLPVQRVLDREPGATALALLRRIAAEARSEIGASDDDGRLAEASLLLAKLATDRRPALIVVDDVDALDERSRDLMVRLMLHSRRPPCLWMWARRGGGDDVLDVAADAGEMERVTLGPLLASDCERLVAARLNDVPPAGLATQLRDKTQGHPGLLVEMLRSAARAGALRETEAGVVVDAPALAAMALPLDFEEACLSRLAGLDDGGRRTRRVIAACDGRASEAELAAMGVTLAAPAARALLATALVERSEAGAWRLQPPSLARTLLARANDRERREAYDAALQRGQLPHVERFRLLAELGRTDEALEVAERAFATAPSEGLALRAAEVGTTTGAAPVAAWWLRAARFARESGRYEIAGERYTHALEHTTPAATMPTERGPRGEAWEGLVVSLLRCGNYDMLDRRAEEALAEPLDPVTRAHVLVEQAAGQVQQGRFVECAPLVARAEAAAAESGDPVALALAALSRMNVSQQAPLEEQRALMQHVLDLADKTSDRTLQLRVRVMALAMPPDAPLLRDGQQVVQDVVAQARREGPRFLLHTALGQMMSLRVRAGAWLATIQTCHEGTRLAIEDGRRADAADWLVLIAILDALTGHASAARRRLQAAVRVGKAASRHARAALPRVLARIARTAGRLAASERWARLAARRAQRSGDQLELLWGRLELAATLTARRRWPEVTELALASPDSVRRDVVGTVIMHAHAGRGLLRSGDLPGAAERLSQIDGMLRDESLPYAAAHASVLRAELALMRDDASAARAGADAAIAAFESLPCPLDRAYALLELSELALQRTVRRHAPVREWLSAAREVFERHRDNGRLVRVLEAEIDAASSDAPAPSGGMSDRDLVQAFAGMLRSLSEPQVLAHRAMDLAGRRFGAERGVLVMHDKDTDSLQTLAEYGAVDSGAREHALGYSTRIVREVTRSGSSLVIRDAKADSPLASASQRALGLRSILCVPLFIDGRVGGAMYMDDSRRAALFSEADRGLLEAFSRLIGLAIERGRSQEQVERENAELIDDNQQLSRVLEERVQSDELILGSHPRVQHMLAQIHRAARTPRTSVLVTGETGTGKELVALRIHGLSDRAKGPFRALNCGAVPRDLMASKLFGHVRGAFTNAIRDEAGLFERASGGTLFLDEIADMPLEQQVMLLRVLQSREFSRVGTDRTISADVRVIAATNRDLELEVREGRFRQDLFYRLNVIHIEVPPLRERKSDVLLLAQHFLEKWAAQMNRDVPRMSKELSAALIQSDWPGNVRELEHYMERLLAMTPGEVLRPDPPPRDLAEGPDTTASDSTRRLIEAVELLEVRLIREALDEAEGNQSLAARTLGVPETTLRYRLRKYARHFSRENRRTRR